MDLGTTPYCPPHSKTKTTTQNYKLKLFFMRKLLLTLAVLCGTVSAWAEVTPTEQLKASTILPSMGIPENQYYVLQTKDGGA